jgi:hypothetical protein
MPGQQELQVRRAQELAESRLLELEELPGSAGLPEALVLLE